MIPIAASLLLQFPEIQTKVVQKVTRYLSEELKTEVSIDRVSITFLTDAEFENIYIEDLKSDTLLYAEKLTIDIGWYDLFGKELELENVRLVNANVELKKYESAEQFNYQFIQDHFKSQDTATGGEGWKIELNKFELVNSSLTYINNNKEKKKRGIDFNNIHLKALDIEVEGIGFEEDTTSLQLNRLKFIDHSGFTLRELKSSLSISPAGMSFEDLELQTVSSKINADLSFETNSFEDYNDFNEKVKFLGNFKNTEIVSNDLMFFVDALEGMSPQKITLDGLVKGKVSNLKGKDLKLTLNNETKFKGNLDLKGLPNLEETFIYLSIKELKTQAKYLEKLPKAPLSQGHTLKVPKELYALGSLSFKGKFTGFLSDFVAYGKFNTDLGSINTDLSLKGQGANVKFLGSVQTAGFALGGLFDKEQLINNLSFNLNVNGKGSSIENLKAEVNGEVSSIEVNQKKFKNITLKGEIANQRFNGDLVIKDELLDMDFIGSVDFINELPELNFLANVNHLGIGAFLENERIDTSLSISSTMNIDFIGNSIDNLKGKFELYNTQLSTDEDDFYIEEVVLNANRVNEKRTLELISDLVDMHIDGRYQLEDLAKSSRAFIDKYIPAVVGKKYDTIRISEDFNFNARFKNTELLSVLFFPEIEIDSGTYVVGYYNSLGNQLTLDLKLAGGRVNNTMLSPGYITAQTQENTLYLNSQLDRIAFSKSIYADNFTLISSTEKNKTKVGITWDTESDASKGDINFVTSFINTERFEFDFDKSEVFIADTLWSIPDSSKIVLDSTAIEFSNFSLASNYDKIEIDGKISDNPSDQLNFEVDNFNLSLFNLIIPEKSAKLEGKISGLASIKDPYKNLIFTSNIDFDNFKVNDNLLGSGQLKSFWINEMEVLSLDCHLLRGKLPTLEITGNYLPKSKENSLNMKLQLRNTYLQLFQPYLQGSLSHLRGLVSGKVDINGTLKKPLLKGSLEVQKAGFTIDYLKTAYNFSDKIIIEPDWIGFDNITIYDTKRGKAQATGTIFHDNYRDFNMDIFLIADKFHCLNTTAADNELYYGQAFVSGEVDVSGYANNLIIDVDVKTERSNAVGRQSAELTRLNIPLNSISEVEENNFVRFVNDSVDQKKNIVIKEADLSGIQMNFGLEVTTDAEVRLIFDEKVGDVLRSSGTGNMKLAINTKGDFNIYGEYEVDEGDYLFTLQNIINKKFILQRGGSISWNGDPYAATLDLTAIYKLRARLADIIITPEENADYTKRTPVELNLNMKNTILSPDISFDINLPNADENTKGLLRNVLYVGTDKTNENLMNKQAFSLLILNRFTPPDQGITGSGFGATSSSEVLSNQLSNWLSQISKDVDIGFTYRPGDELATDQVEVFFSTGIFNDRVVLNGNFEYGGSQVVNQDNNTNTYVGEGNVEYKITEDGKFRVKAFNKANNNNFLENNNPYTQGVGLSYRHSFNTFSELWKQIRGKDKKSKN